MEGRLGREFVIAKVHCRSLPRGSRSFIQLANQQDLDAMSHTTNSILDQTNCTYYMVVIRVYKQLLASEMTSSG